MEYAPRFAKDTLRKKFQIFLNIFFFETLNIKFVCEIKKYWFVKYYTFNLHYDVTEY